MEICISSLNIYLDSRVAAFRQRLKISEIGLEIERAYERLKIKFRNRKRRRRRAKIISGQFKNQWKKRWLNIIGANNNSIISERSQKRTSF
jgi:hypothetical protein